MGTPTINDLETQFVEARQRLAHAQQELRTAETKLQTAEAEVVQVKKEALAAGIEAELDNKPRPKGYDERIRRAEVAVAEKSERLAVLRGVVERRTEIVDQLHAEIEARKLEAYFAESIPMGAKVNEALLTLASLADQFWGVAQRHQARWDDMMVALWAREPYEGGQQYMRDFWLQYFGRVSGMLPAMRRLTTIPIDEWNMRRVRKHREGELT